MAITTDLETSIGQLRLLIGDDREGDGVKPSGDNFSDAELTFFYQEGGSLNLAAALACESLAWQWNTQASFSADGLRVDRGDIAGRWFRAARQFRANQGARLLGVTRQDAYSQAIAANEAGDVVDGEGIDP
jgi:hypothetical protein